MKLAATLTGVGTVVAALALGTPAATAQDCPRGDLDTR